MGDDSTRQARAGLFRRLAALLYDLLLVLALAFVATFAMLPLSHGEAILTSTQGNLGRLYHALLVAVVFGYFGLCWTRSGQTLGFRAWRLRLETGVGDRLGWTAAAGRFLLGGGIAVLAILGTWYLRAPGSALTRAAAALLVAPAVLNFAWIPFDREARSLLDVALRSRVERVG
jgi:uncharacterized RDD family membrane protein YckC